MASMKRFVSFVSDDGKTVTIRESEQAPGKYELVINDTIAVLNKKKAEILLNAFDDLLD
jgi:hypothetical protein